MNTTQDHFTTSEKRKLRLLQEPLVQFFLLAIIVFSLSAFLSQEQISATPHIKISQQAVDNFKQDFVSRYGNQPKKDEVEQFKSNWINEEILYREGLNLNLEKHDDMVRDRVINKMKLLLTGSLQPAKDRELEAFMLEHKSLYQNPEQYTFYLASLDQSRLASDLKPAQYTRLLINALNQGGDPRAMGLAVQLYENKRPGFLNARFSPDLVQQLDRSIKNPQWQPFHIKGTDYLVKLASFKPAQLPELSEIRLRVAKDWRNQQSKLQLQNQLLALQQSYVIEQLP